MSQISKLEEVMKNIESNKDKINELLKRIKTIKRGIHNRKKKK